MKLIATIFFAFCTLCKAYTAELIWFDGQHPITYQMPKMVEPVVKVALEMWKDDMQQVTGVMPVASSKAVVKMTKVASIPGDGFHIYIEDGQIVIESSNGRGMAYGLLELSRQAGVSPWIWWGDIVPEKKNRLTIDSDYHTEQSPSVAYRGIFLNDEDWSLRPWSNKTFEPGPKGQIGPKTYRKIFELLLRLRANTIWPAMHEGTVAFFQTPDAKAIADSCGIVIGSSHCEPLLRNNVGEWGVEQRGRFNYKTNREAVQQYWIERLKEVKNSNDNMFTIGMRGIHDSSMEGYNTDQEKFDALQQVIDDQQRLLKKYIGDPSKQMQVFVPYKEVLQLYQMKLKVPDYVTLMWCDDNYGYMTRLSNAEEQQRQGGAGLYYHLSYWGRPHDYLWLTTTQPGLIYNELRQAYDHNVRKLWIANVHDPKVACYDLELFLDMAWNINCVSGSTLNNHLKAWLCRQFGQEAGQKLFPAMHGFYRLCGERKPEFMGWTQVELDKKKYHRGLSTVDSVGFTAIKAGARMSAFKCIKEIVKESRPSIRAELSDAFFAAIEYPIYAAAAMNRKILCDSAESHQAYEEIQSLTRQYHEMNRGKWRYLMDAAPRRLPVFENVHAKLSTQTTEVIDTLNACDYTEATAGAETIQMLGHSMQAISLPMNGRLSYRFEVKADGEYTIQTALVPTHPIDDGDLRFSLSIDGQTPTIFNLKEPFRSEEWKRNVLRAQALRQHTVHLNKGSHELSIQAIDNHIVVDQIVIKKHTIFNVKSFGAVGDGVHIDSPAINAAIEQASANGGGTVVIGKGTYLCYSIHLKSNITLRLEKDAVIKAAPVTATKGYDEPEPNDSHYQDFGHSHWHNSLLWGENLHHVTLEGEGLIDGTDVLTRGEPKRGYTGPTTANKALALRDCHHVVIRGLRFLKCGHFALLLTGVDDLLIDAVTCDTNRDGFDIDCCERVTVRNCRVNTMNDDAIVLKCSYALGCEKPTEHVLIEDCEVSGYDIGTLMDGTRTTHTEKAPDGDGPTGRIKLGTESNGGFRHITIRQCTFNHCRGLALETVDGAEMKDIRVSHLTMNDICNSPIYIRLGDRMRAPEGFHPSSVSDIRISDVHVTDADSRYACLIAGIEGRRVRDVRIERLYVLFRGGLTMKDYQEQRGRNPFFIPEARQPGDFGEANYPEPSAHGIQPAWGFAIYHSEDIQLKDVRLETIHPDERPMFHFEDTSSITNH